MLDHGLVICNGKGGVTGSEKTPWAFLTKIKAMIGSSE